MYSINVNEKIMEEMMNVFYDKINFWNYGYLQVVIFYCHQEG